MRPRRLPSWTAAPPRTGRYRIGGEGVLPAEHGTPAFSCADLAVALIDEVEAPGHHRALVAVAP